MDDQVFTPAVFYRDPKAALQGQGNIMVGAQWDDWVSSPAGLGGKNTQTVHVQLPDGLDQHCERARTAGATIAAEPKDEFYGDRSYRAVDVEGHRWTFSTRIRDVSKAEAERALGQPIMATNWA